MPKANHGKLKGAIMFNNILKSSYLIQEINLQLFAEEDLDEVSGDEDSVVDYQEEFEEVADLEEFEEGEKEEEVAEPLEEEERVQTSEENAQFKRMRLKAEAEAQKKFEAERAEFERQKKAFEEQQAEKKIREEYLSQQKIWDKADEEGVSEETAKKMLELEVEKVITSERTKVKERFEALQAQKAKYQADPLFNIVNEKADYALQSNPNLDYDTAYLFYRGQMALDTELNKEQEKKTVKRTIANVQDGMRRRTVPTTGGNTVDVNSVLSKEGQEMASAFGLDPRKVAKRVASKLKNKE
jgi:hypothetical protein